MATPEPGERSGEAEVIELPRPATPPSPIDLDKLASESAELGLLGRLQIHLLAFLSNIPYWAGQGTRRLPFWLWWALRDPLVGIGRVAYLMFRWLHMAEEREAIRQMESRDAKAKAKRDVNQDGRFRIIVTAILFATVLLAHVVAFFLGYGLWLAGEALGIYGLLFFLGHKPKAETDGPVRRRGPLTHGTSARSLRKDLEEGFAAKKMPDVGVIGLTVNRYGWHGVFETELAFDDKVIEHLERWVHAPEGSLLVTVDERNAAARPFKLLIEDPLAHSSVPELPQEPRDIRQLATVGRHLFGKPLLVNLRQHIGLIGRSGSGKSSGFWVLIDWVTSCFNSEADGIDLSQGPALPAWRKSLRKVAVDAAGAKEILLEAIALATARNAKLAEMAESDEDDEGDENWDPTGTEKARYIFIDEFHLVADDKELLALVKTLIRIGRKACVYLVLGTPGASKEDVGSVVIKGMIGLKILFACIQQDVTNFLGGKMIEQGWRPDKLRPAAGGDPKDAGKAYLWDGDHQTPEVVRISRLTLGECKRRARLRAYSRGPAWDILQAAFAHYDTDRIPTRWLGEFITESYSDWSLEDLQTELRILGVTTEQLGDGPWKGNPRGYRRR